MIIDAITSTTTPTTGASPRPCTQCGEPFPLTAEYWYRDAKNSSGFRQPCKACTNASQKITREKRKDKIREYLREYRQRRKVHIRETARVRAARRKENLRNAEGTHTKAEVRALFKAQGGLCFHCRADLVMEGYHKDHWIPLSRGGRNDISNIRLLCPACSYSKGSKLASEWSDKYSE